MRYEIMRGQTLVTLLFFTIIAINVTAVATIIIMINSLSGSKFQQGVIAYEIAQSGVEDAKLRLLRDPDYTGTGGQPLQIGNGSVLVTVDKSDSQYTILSKGTIGNFTRQIELTASYSANLLRVLSQQEVF